VPSGSVACRVDPWANSPNCSDVRFASPGTVRYAAESRSGLSCGNAAGTNTMPETVACLSTAIQKARDRQRPTECPADRPRCQEQIKMIATAIGKPIARAVAIVDAKANSRSSSGCTLSSSGMAYSTNRKAKKPSSGRSDKTASSAHAHCVQKPPANGCLKMVNKLLIAVTREPTEPDR
jgi:hypothetical protein